MKREYPDTPLVGVGAIIIEDGRVALVKRGHPPLLGEWSIPGGAMEIGETVREAAAREACEETGLNVEVLELLGIYDRCCAMKREGSATITCWWIFCAGALSGDLVPRAMRTKPAGSLRKK